MKIYNNEKTPPQHLNHKPIVYVNYEFIDAKEKAGDAKYLSIGKAQWDNEEISAKILRKTSDNRWSRQNEEIPLWRVLDLAELLIGVILDRPTSLDEKILSYEDKDILDSYIVKNRATYVHRIEEIKNLFSNHKEKKEQNIEKPNIFSFATSELSQDAILAWIIQWGDDKYFKTDALLCTLGKAMISLLTGIEIEMINSVLVECQWNNIDIKVEINQDVLLVIEDKKGTSIHDQQLERYKKIVIERYGSIREKLFFAYVKTDNEPENILNHIRSLGYNAINRKDIIKVLKTYKGNETLIENYLSYLNTIEKNSNEFKIRPVEEWGWHGWQGFYKELEKYINVESWSFIANPSGGFLGLWWNTIVNNPEKVKMFLQFEESKLCVKINYWGNKDKTEIVNKFHNKLMDVAKLLDIEINRPRRLCKNADSVTIGIVSLNYIFPSGKFDRSHLLSKLKEVENLVNLTMK